MTWHDDKWAPHAEAFKPTCLYRCVPFEEKSHDQKHPA